MNNRPYKKLSIPELYAMKDDTGIRLSDRSQAEAEIAEKMWVRNFRTKGIVAWIALIIGATSLIWQIVKELR